MSLDDSVLATTAGASPNGAALPAYPPFTRDLSVELRRATPADAEACGLIIYEAFNDIAARHGFPPDFPTIASGIQLARSFIAHPKIFSIVAEANGRIVGSNFLAEGDAIRAVGPISVSPHTQGRGIGRRLMQAVIERGRGASGIRLLQDGFNMLSLSLYASLGFDAREPMVVMSGRPKSKAPAGVTVRPVTEQDLPSCDALSTRVHGFPRSNELKDALRALAPVLVQRDGRVTAYLTAPRFWIANHGVAESEEDMKALILGAGAADPEHLSFLLPVRHANLFRWCLNEGLRAVKPMTLMTIGRYEAPHGSYLTSVLY